MTVPVRVQLRRTKGWRLPANTVKVDRTTRWGNPIRRGDLAEFNDGSTVVRDDAQAVDYFRRFRQSMDTAFPSDAEIQRDLGGKNLACWCKPGAPCHADVLLALANPDIIVECFVCAVPFKDGDPYYPDASGGSLHAACCGPERESYTIDDRPLRDGEAIPEPSIWSYAEFLGQAATSQPKD